MSKGVELLIRRKAGTEDVPLPKYMSEHAAGMDVCAAVDKPLVIPPGRISLVPTGLFMALAPGYEVQVRPRSGLALKSGITIANTPGTIDADYRGEVGIIVVNLGSDAFEITRGMRIAQLVVAPVTQATVRVVGELPGSLRGDGGFGSTGKA